MTTLRVSLLAAAAAALSPLVAGAQRTNTVELGGFGRYNLYADTLRLDPANGFGGRVAYFFRPNWALEGEVAWAEPRVRGQVPADSLRQVAHPLYSYRVTYNKAIDNRVALLLGGGYAYDSYQRPRVVAPRGGGPTALVGLRFRLSEVLSARVEGTGTYVIPENRPAMAKLPSHFNYGAQAGLSVLLFSKEPVPVVRTEVVRVVQRDTVYITRIDTVRVAGPVPRPVVIGAVNFSFNRQELSPEAKKILDLIAESLVDPQNASRTVAVTGSTDAVGSERYNLALGQSRADQVKAYLVAKGVGANRIQARTQGEKDPVAPNTTADGRATNRRVLVILTN